jgi:hypothetical protein
MAAPVFHLINNAPKPVGPYSHVVEAEGWLFVTGQLATDPIRKLRFGAAVGAWCQPDSVPAFRSGKFTFTRQAAGNVEGRGTPPASSGSRGKRLARLDAGAARHRTGSRTPTPTFCWHSPTPLSPDVCAVSLVRPRR